MIRPGMVSHCSAHIVAFAKACCSVPGPRVKLLRTGGLSRERESENEKNLQWLLGDRDWMKKAVDKKAREDEPGRFDVSRRGSECRKRMERRLRPTALSPLLP